MTIKLIDKDGNPIDTKSKDFLEFPKDTYKEETEFEFEVKVEHSEEATNENRRNKA